MDLDQLEHDYQKASGPSTSHGRRVSIGSAPQEDRWLVRTMVQVSAIMPVITPQSPSTTAKITIMAATITSMAATITATITTVGP